MFDLNTCYCNKDGAHMDSKQGLSIGTTRKIRELNRAGVPFMVVSARTPSHILAMSKATDEMKMFAKGCCSAHRQIGATHIDQFIIIHSAE